MAAFCFITALLLAVSLGVHCSCPPSDRAALLAFKAALPQRHLSVFDSWTGNDCCRNWYGVNCDQQSGRVADISLRGDSLPSSSAASTTGSISPQICKLTRLSSIIISDWEGLGGQIPGCISSLVFLRIIDLNGNSITGVIPADIGKLSELIVLNLADNSISGTIPESLTNLGNLKHLDLRNNKISGAIPRSLGKMKMVSRLLVGRNEISGDIPSSIGGVYRLVDLDLSENKISGAIPELLSKLRVLGTVNVGGNKLRGRIPEGLLKSGISYLNMSHNYLEGNIPDVFGGSSYFTVLDFSYNNLKGSLPRSMNSASYIGFLDVSHNHLCGSIPTGSPFDHLDDSSFLFNDCLCGNPLKPC